MATLNGCKLATSLQASSFATDVHGHLYQTALSLVRSFLPFLFYSSFNLLTSSSEAGLSALLISFFLFSWCGNYCKIMAVRRVRVDDTNPLIQYAGPWFLDGTGSQDKNGNFGPTYNKTLHGTIQDASLSFTFSGESLWYLAWGGLVVNGLPSG